MTIKLKRTCPHISKLLIAFCPRVTDKSIPLLYQKLHFLTELDLSLTSITSSSSHILACMISSKRLRKLDISATKITDKGIQIIASAGTIFPIHLENDASMLPNQIEMMFETATSDQSIRFQHHQSIQQPPLYKKNHQEERKIENAPEYITSKSNRSECGCPLEELKLRHLHSLSIRALEILAVNARKLRVLDLSYCHQLSSVNRNVSYSFFERIMKEFRRNGTEVFDN